MTNLVRNSTFVETIITAVNLVLIQRHKVIIISAKVQFLTKSYKGTLYHKKDYYYYSEYDSQ